MDLLKILKMVSTSWSELMNSQTIKLFKNLSSKRSAVLASALNLGKAKESKQRRRLSQKERKFRKAVLVSGKMKPKKFIQLRQQLVGSKTVISFAKVSIKHALLVNVYLPRTLTGR